MKLLPRLVFIVLILCVAVSAGICETAAGSGCVKDRASFDVAYQNYREACCKWCADHPGCTAWRYPGTGLVDMGPAAVPFLIGKMAKREDPDRFSRQFSAVAKLTRKRFAVNEYTEAARAGTMGDLFVNWWNQRKETPARFAALCREWDKAGESGNLEKAQQAIDQIRDMGVDALPLIMEKIKSGNDRCVPLVSRIMGEQIGGRPESVMQWWSANEERVRLPDPA